MTTVALFGVSISMALCLYRLVIGPATVDRVLALDTIATNTMALLVILSVRLGTTAYFESVMVLAVLAFLGTVAISKYLMRGKIID